MVELRAGVCGITDGPVPASEAPSDPVESMRVLVLEQSERGRSADGKQPIMATELGVRVFEMLSHGTRADAQNPSNRSCREPIGEQREDLHLPVSQAVALSRLGAR